MNCGYYSEDGRLIDESNVPSGRAEYRLAELERGAQELANECRCSIKVWLRNEDGEPTSYLGVLANPLTEVDQ